MYLQKFTATTEYFKAIEGVRLLKEIGPWGSEGGYHKEYHCNSAQRNDTN